MRTFILLCGLLFLTSLLAQDGLVEEAGDDLAIAATSNIYQASQFPWDFLPPVRMADYALHSFRLVPQCRSRFTGAAEADHDLVMYQFSVCEIEASKFMAPARSLLEVNDVSSETFLEYFPLQEFLRIHDIQAAWNLLSNSAEHVLKPSAGRPRCKIPLPTEPAKAPTKPDTLQSMTERKLRRTLRRVLENQSDANAPWSLFRKFVVMLTSRVNFRNFLKFRSLMIFL